MIINMIILILFLICLIILFLIFYKKPETFENNNKIPKVIYLSYKTKDIPEYVISKWKKVYPDYEIKLYDNNDCIQFLDKEFGKEYVDIFNYIKDGPIKADFWRVCILYKYGGIYSDIDIEPLVNINKIIYSDTTFITCLSAGFFKLTNPHFIVSEPNHKVLKKCIDKYLEMFKANKEYSYWGWSIVYIMKDVLYNIFDKYITDDGIYFDKDDNKYQFLKEVSEAPKFIFDLKKIWLRLTNTGIDMHCRYNNIIILNNKYNSYLDHEFK
jgi:hypothetical protein